MSGLDSGVDFGRSGFVNRPRNRAIERNQNRPRRSSTNRPAANPHRVIDHPFSVAGVSAHAAYISSPYGWQPVVGRAILPADWLSSQSCHLESGCGHDSPPHRKYAALGVSACLSQHAITPAQIRKHGNNPRFVFSLGQGRKVVAHIVPIERRRAKRGDRFDVNQVLRAVSEQFEDQKVLS